MLDKQKLMFGLFNGSLNKMFICSIGTKGDMK
jgi:hypothetical protein